VVLALVGCGFRWFFDWFLSWFIFGVGSDFERLYFLVVSYIVYCHGEAGT
jgi:hypothetical protein